MLWMDSNSGWKYLQSKYSPTRMPAHSFQNAKDCSALQRQAGTLERGRFIECFRFLCGCIEGAQSGESSSSIDQAIFYRPLARDYTISRHSIAFYVHRHGTWQQRWLSLLAGLLRKTRHVVRHVSCWMLVACCIFPNVGIPQVQRSACFFVTLIFAVLWFLYDFMVLLPSHNQMNQLLAHAELGIDARKFLRPSLFAKHWMPEAWKAMYNADPVVDGSRHRLQIDIERTDSPGRGGCNVVYVY